MKKVIWITGASTGIGACVAEMLANRGWQVAVSARSEDKLKALAEHNNIHAYPCDVTKISEMRDCADAIEKDLGPIDRAYFNAGMFIPDTFENYSAANLKKHYEVNVFGVANGVDVMLPRFKQRGKGHIAMTASVAGYMGLPRAISYGSTKAALINMAESLWHEGRKHNIKVQVICPGFVKTPMTAQNKFPMPMIIEVEEAAKHIVNGFNSEKFEITFPRGFSWILKTVSNIMYWAKLRLIYWATQKAMKGRG